MTIESFQDTLFEDPIGLRFRHAREKARLSLDSVAQQLKLPVAILDAIEREDWTRLGAPIFIRSYVGSYAKVLGLPVTLADEVVRGKPAPQLIAIAGTPPARRVFDRSLTNLAYLAMTIVIVGSVVVLAMYLQSPRRGAEVLPMDATSAYANNDVTPLNAPGSQASAQTGVAASQVPAAAQFPAPAVSAQSADAPVMASLTPQLPSSATGDGIVLYFRGPSWVDIVDRQGAHVQRGMVAAGTEYHYSTSQLAQVTLGDATAVDVSVSGSALDLRPYREANVAHFTVSSEGKISSAPAD
jgi:cytoskeleton protein RodZ